MNELDFMRIKLALQATEEMLANLGAVESLEGAHTDYLQALSHATDIDQKLLRYTT